MQNFQKTKLKIRIQYAIVETMKNVPLEKTAKKKISYTRPMCLMMIIGVIIKMLK